MADNLPIIPSSELATDEADGVHYQRIKLVHGPARADCCTENPLPVAIVSGGSSGSSGGLTNTELRASPVAVSGTFYQATQPISGNVGITGSVAVTGSFYQATQPVSIAASVAVTGPLTDTQLRASAVPVSIASLPTTAVTGTFWPATQPISGTVGVTGSVAVTGSFYQASQPVSIAASVAVTGPLTDTQLRAAAVPVSGTFYQQTQPVSIASMPSTPVTGTFWQTTQPVSGTVTVSQAARVCKIYSATFTAATTEALVTLTPIADGTAGATGTSFAVTSGKRLRLQSLVLSVRNVGAAAQGCVVNLRASASGAVTATSPLIATLGAGTSLATANVVGAGAHSFPDGIELSGTMQLGISQIGTATAGNAVTLIGYEY